MGWLSIAQNQKYQLLSESNRVQLIPVPPRRGWIIDRNGKPIAINRASFRVDIIPQQLEKDRDVVPEARQAALARRGRCRADHGASLRNRAASSPCRSPTTSPTSNMRRITVRLPDLPGVQATRGYSRFYPDGPAVAHLVGYVGTANAKEYEAENKNPLLIIPGFKIGKQGLEKSLEPYLRGTPGGQRVEVTARGKLVKELDPKPDRSGQTVQLTIDEGLQQYAARRMGDQSGALVAMDVASGDILAFVSMPAFDPNSFSDGIGRNEWKMLSENDHIPLLNKVVAGPLSVRLDDQAGDGAGVPQAGHRSASERVHCSGGVPDRQSLLPLRRGARLVDMRRGDRAQLQHLFLGDGAAAPTRANDRRWSTISATARISTCRSRPALRHHAEPEWLKKKYHRKWQGYDSANTSIGQGYVLINPMQLAVMPARLAIGQAASAAAADGRQAQAVPRPSTSTRSIWSSSARRWRASSTMARRSARSCRSTASRWRARPAPRRSSGSSRRAATKAIGQLRDHALFIAFAPADKPRYAIGCIIEHGGFGASAAAPIVRDTMTYLFDQQKALGRAGAARAAMGRHAGRAQRSPDSRRSRPRRSRPPPA